MELDRKPYPEEFYPGCPCFACDHLTWPANSFGPQRMSLCPNCGNKRCPGAADHRNACTNSNEVGQAGSLYADAMFSERTLTDRDADRVQSLLGVEHLEP